MRKEASLDANPRSKVCEHSPSLRLLLAIFRGSACEETVSFASKGMSLLFQRIPWIPVRRTPGVRPPFYLPRRLEQPLGKAFTQQSEP